METIIFDYGMNGEGVAKIDGKIALINNCLVDEVVDAEIVLDNKNYCLARTNKIVKKSKNRVNPPCPYFYSCGGCALQHFSYAEQLKFKTDLVKKTLKKVADINYDVSACVGEETKSFYYRNKTAFQVKNKIGFYAKQTNDLVEIDSCMISAPTINEVLKIFKTFLQDNPARTDIKNLVVRTIDNQTLIGVVAKKFLNLSKFYANLTKKLKNVGLFLIINTRKDIVILTNNLTHIGGIKEIKTTCLGINYGVDLLGFHQTNIEMQNQIYLKVLNLIDGCAKKDVVVNGFSGEGLLTVLIAKKCGKVFGIEIVKESHFSSETLKKDNKIANITNILGDFNKEITKLKNVDFLVLDPSKKGVGKQTMQNIIGIKNIIYISCNPIALAKDLREIKKFYTIEDISPFDMFPQTNSVETVVKLKFKGE